MQAVGAVPFVENDAGRVGQGDDLTDAFGHGSDALFGQRQAVDHGRRHALGFSPLQVDGIGCQDIGFMGDEAVGDGGQGLILFRRRGSGQDVRGFLGVAAFAEYFGYHRKYPL